MCGAHGKVRLWCYANYTSLWVSKSVSRHCLKFLRQPTAPVKTTKEELQCYGNVTDGWTDMTEQDISFFVL